MTAGGVFLIIIYHSPNSKLGMVLINLLDLVIYNKVYNSAYVLSSGWMRDLW